MRYKGNFHPSDLLCPETYKWFPLKDCIPKLEASPYTRLDPDIDSVDENYPSENDLNYIPIWYKGNIMLNKAFRRKYSKKNEDIKELMEYARMIGNKTLNKLVLFRA
jgi:arginyl-tRNA---protein transferase